MSEKGAFTGFQKDGLEETIQQVAGICGRATGLKVLISPDRCSLYSSAPPSGHYGIVSCSGRFADPDLIVLDLELVRTEGSPRVSSSALFKHLASLGDRTRVIPPVVQKDGTTALWVELKIQAEPLTLTRSGGLLSEIKHLDSLAKSLQAELPREWKDQDLKRIYEGVLDCVEPVHPWVEDGTAADSALLDWARETMEFLTGFTSVSVSAASPVLEGFGLALLSRAGQEAGIPLGRLTSASIAPKSLSELIRKIPGTVAVQSVRLSLGTNAYELAHEVQAMLGALHATGTPVLFTGTMDQLRTVFHGGQGGVSDPLSPVVRHLPEIQLPALARFAVQSAARLRGGLSVAAEDQAIVESLDAVKEYRPAEQRRILAAVANRVVHQHAKGKTGDACAFAFRISSATETLSGVSARPRSMRFAGVQDRFTQVFTDSNLATFLREHLLAQDDAIDHLVSRLRMESLTRPLHQPLRYCAQGTPATGKSESAMLLAQRLEIPFINIDAASIPDYYTAAAQLLGSGRGIVGSYQSGRLEQAAKHHTGALIEVSDLDHANERVRSGLADLFLQVLETGEAQSATGAMFSCANLIFAFTMNLPDGRDEAVRKGLGFNHNVSAREVQSRVISEIKKMLSTAFLSRVGTPILFEPLDGEAIAGILERAVRAAILAAADRLQCHIGGVDLQTDLGMRLSLQNPLASFGARALLEQGRSLAADAFVKLHHDHPDLQGKTLCVCAVPDNRLTITVK